MSKQVKELLARDVQRRLGQSASGLEKRRRMLHELRDRLTNPVKIAKPSPANTASLEMNTTSAPTSAAACTTCCVAFTIAARSLAYAACTMSDGRTRPTAVRNAASSSRSAPTVGTPGTDRRWTRPTTSRLSGIVRSSQWPRRPEAPVRSTGPSTTPHSIA